MQRHLLPITCPSFNLQRHLRPIIIFPPIFLPIFFIILFHSSFLIKILSSIVHSSRFQPTVSVVFDNSVLLFRKKKQKTVKFFYFHINNTIFLEKRSAKRFGNWKFPRIKRGGYWNRRFQEQKDTLIPNISSKYIGMFVFFAYFFKVCRKKAVLS